MDFSLIPFFSGTGPSPPKSLTLLLKSEILEETATVAGWKTLNHSFHQHSPFERRDIKPVSVLNPLFLLCRRRGPSARSLIFLVYPHTCLLFPPQPSRDLSREFHEFQKLMTSNQQRLQVSLEQMQNTITSVPHPAARQVSAGSGMQQPSMQMQQPYFRMGMQRLA